MAEGGFLARFLRGGEEEAGGGAEALASALDPAAAAAAMDEAKTHPGLAERAATYFDEQTRLVKLQTEHLHEQRLVQLSHLKLRRFTDRLQAATQIFIILVAALIGLGVLVMLHDAFTSRTVVVDAFKAPSALASRGVTGDVVAGGVLDALQKLQAATRSWEVGLAARGAWDGDVKIEVPETGVSIGEVSRLLHERFGHDLHIDGDLIQTESGGLALTVRGDGVPASTFAGDAGDLDKLTVQAAEYLYGRSQPTRYASYLIGNRDEDALGFLPGAFARARNDDERTDLAISWGNAYGDLGQAGPAIEKYRLVMALSKPKSVVWWVGWSNIVATVAWAQGEEAGWRESQPLLRAVAAASKREQPYPGSLIPAAGSTWDLPLMLKSLQADLALHGGLQSLPTNLRSRTPTPCCTIRFKRRATWPPAIRPTSTPRRKP